MSRCLYSLVVLILLTGCLGEETDGRLALSGTVTFQSEPLDQGSIELVADDGSQQTGAPVVNGEFSIPAPQGLRPGTFIVRVFSTEEPASDEPTAPGPESMEPQGKERIPAEFNVESKLTAEITENGDNHFTFDIK